MRTFGLLIATVSVLAFAGCNESKTGAFGNVDFTPDECGRVGGCDFDDSIGVGGLINVQIMAADPEFSTAGLDLASDDPSVLDIYPIADVGGRPTWEAVGVAPGVARIAALDGDGVEVDFIEVGVQNLSGLELDNFVGDAVGPTSDVDFDEIWQVNANQNTSFYVVPTIGDGAPTMGRYTYTVFLDQSFTPYLVEGNDHENGYLYFNAEEGYYPVTFVEDVSGLEINVMLEVVAGQ